MSNELALFWKVLAKFEEKRSFIIIIYETLKTCSEGQDRLTFPGVMCPMGANPKARFPNVNLLIKCVYLFHPQVTRLDVEV